MRRGKRSRLVFRHCSGRGDGRRGGRECTRGQHVRTEVQVDPAVLKQRLGEGNREGQHVRSCGGRKGVQCKDASNEHCEFAAKRCRGICGEGGDAADERCDGLLVRVCTEKEGISKKKKREESAACHDLLRRAKSRQRRAETSPSSSSGDATISNA